MQEIAKKDPHPNKVESNWKTNEKYINQNSMLEKIHTDKDLLKISGKKPIQ